MNTPTKVIWHHSGGTDANPCLSTQGQNVNTIDNWHKTKWPGFQSTVYKNKAGEGWHVGYHFVIDVKQRQIHQCRGFSEEGAHTIGMNTSSIGVLIIGNYDECSPDVISSDMYPLIQKVWKKCQTAAPRLQLTDNVPHRTYARKSCYGTKYSDTFVQRVLGDPGAKKIAIMKQVVELLEKKVALLLQMLSGRRLSLKENKYDV